jgi:hypothetical protein
MDELAAQESSAEVYMQTLEGTPASRDFGLGVKTCRPSARLSQYRGMLSGMKFCTDGRSDIPLFGSLCVAGLEGRLTPRAETKHCAPFNPGFLFPCSSACLFFSF